MLQSTFMLPIHSEQMHNSDENDRETHPRLLSVAVNDLACVGSVLREQSQLVKDITSSETISVCQLLREAFYSIPYAKGLSAVQLGILKQVAMINLSRVQGREVFFINPRSIKLSGRLIIRSEGCLCLPHYKATIARRNNIRLSAYNLSGHLFTYCAVGYEAAVIQHELDHMAGRFYWDHLPTGTVPQRIPI